MDTIYSQPVCPGCAQLKQKYKDRGEEFKEVIIGVDISVEDFRKQYPDVRTVPFVVPDVI